MLCTLKSNIKLASNIIKNKDKLGFYIPADLKPPEYSDSRLWDQLTDAQRDQYIKRLFYAKEIRDSDTRFCDLPENTETCKNCPNRKICC